MHRNLLLTVALVAAALQSKGSGDLLLAADRDPADTAIILGGAASAARANQILENKGPT